MRAFVVGARDDCPRQRRSSGVLHGCSNPIWVLQRDGAYCRATAAKESAKRTCFFGLRDDPWKK